ncbi:MAG: type II secretion system minor pseudopilin GspK [Rubrivivax sp.]|nr:type II secretion system minor pseudopilin GspK [Rubrivivax sp.]
MKARRRQRGAALLLAMVILTMVVTVTTGMLWQQTRAVEVEAAERARAQASWILVGALDWARLILSEDERTNRQRGRNFDALDEPWATPLAEARLSTFLAADQDNNVDAGPEAFISGAIVDAQSRLNLRGLVDNAGKVVPVQLAALQQLCRLAGVAEDAAQRIAAGLGAAGAAAEDAQAEAGPEASPETDAPLRPSRLADLAWFDIDADTLSRLAPWVDLLPVATPVNVNTAPREVLAAAIDGLDLGTAERLVQQRQRKPFASLAEVKAQLGEGLTLDAARVSVNSRFFEVAGRLRLEERVLEERSLLERRPGGRRGNVVVVRREKTSYVTDLR